MTIGILKSKSVFVNQIVAFLRESITLKKQPNCYQHSGTKMISQKIGNNNLEGVTIKIRKFYCNR